ncbi:MAG TPA: succinate dehydrogenase, cytochrome b556 subunit [Rhodospirillaceae bacterium]|jgi:succinate dehydrogenase / fumarate reductase cytochrome b subunit|nr:succinate dehydrogenase, cytochrome b556 subunit [Alphaproteobacteria bacterium]HBH25810.1 succinate dehydrogenase, cytochrome b556 subunit [Rhodospirillaceae bacterium]
MENTAQRPLSPFWSVINRQRMTSGLSILHRATGVWLGYGLVMFAWWLIAAALGPGSYAVFTWYCGSLWGLATLAPLTAIGAYHALNGVRHLIWDCGGLLDLKAAKLGGVVVLAATALVTLGLWAYLIPVYYLPNLYY